MKREAWGVFTGRYRITKEPKTQYEAELAKLEWQKIFQPIEVREVSP